MLNEYKQGLVCERKIKILMSDQQGLVANLTESWMAEQIQEFLGNWNE